MGIADLNRVDIVYEDEAGLGLVAVATGWEPEALRLAQLQAKTVAMRSYGAGLDRPFRVELVCTDDPPPEAAVAHVVAVGGLVRSVQEDAAVTTRPGRFPPGPDGELDLDALQVANAAAFAAEHGLDGSVESLRRVDELLQARRAAEGYGPDDEADGLDDGDLIVLAGAYTGEALRGALGGAWEPPTVGGSTLPSVRVAEGRLAVQVCGKVRKFLHDGTSESVHGLVLAVLETAREG